MIWTIVMIVAAVILYMFAGFLFHKDAKGKMSMMAMFAKKALKLIGIVLLIWGVARTGIGTNYYLTTKNPAILQTMAQNMQAQQQELLAKAAGDYVKDMGKSLEEHAPILGNVNAKNTIYIWSDYMCPYCRRTHGELMRVLQDKPDTRVVVKNFSIHGPLSDDAAKATIAAKMQSNDKAQKLDQLLMAKEYWPSDLNGKSPDEIQKAVLKNILDLAQKAGLSVAQLQEDMNSKTVSDELAQVRDAAQKLQINGTPYLIINGRAFPGAISYDQIVSALK